MDEYVLNSIKVRKSTIYDNYQNVTPEIEAKLNDIYNRMLAFGEKYNDVMEFEKDFQESDLNKEYIQLFTELATVNGPGTVSFKDSAFNPKNYSKEDIGNMLKDEAKEDLKYVIRDRVTQARHETYIERDQALREIPGVGEVIQAKRTMDTLGRIFKRKK